MQRLHTSNDSHIFGRYNVQELDPQALDLSRPATAALTAKTARQPSWLVIYTIYILYMGNKLKLLAVKPAKPQ